MTGHVTDLKLYQVGTFAAGNRLLDLEDRSVQANPERANSITSGHRACQGCGEALGARYVLDAAMRATGGDMVVAKAGAFVRDGDKIAPVAEDSAASN